MSVPVSARGAQRERSRYNMNGFAKLVDNAFPFQKMETIFTAEEKAGV